MGVFKSRTTVYRDAEGRRCGKGDPGARACAVVSRRWYGRYRDADGRTVTRALSTDRSAAKMLLAKLETDARLAAAGLGDRRGGRKALLCDLVDRYRRHLLAKGDTARHVGATVARVRRIADSCRFVRPADVEGSRVAEALAGWRRAGMSAETSNHYLRAIKGFWGWLRDEELTDRDPLRAVKPVNAEADRRRRRRVLGDDEFARLLAAARASPAVVRGLSGPDRAMLYLVAARTGLRASECASLAPGSFDFAAGTVSVEAGYSKRRRRDVLPLAADLTAPLRAWLAGRPADAPLWPGRWAAQGLGAAMVRVDLAAAGIPYATAEGVADFHSIRSRFVTGLALAGVNLAVAQKLARHSTPTLTANSYTRLELEALRASLDRPRGRPRRPRPGPGADSE